LSKLAEAIARLERAVARLEAAAAREPRRGEDEQVAAAAAAITGRLDVALAKLSQLLEREEA
jgi:hypothetical protein